MNVFDGDSFVPTLIEELQSLPSVDEIRELLMSREKLIDFISRSHDLDVSKFGYSNVESFVDEHMEDFETLKNVCFE